MEGSRGRRRPRCLNQPWGDPIPGLDPCFCRGRCLSIGQMNSGPDLTSSIPAAEVNILGLSAFYHDSAACLVRDGKIIAAAQEERFTRKKHDASFPKHAAAYCLQEAGYDIGGVDFVAFYEKPFLKFDRILHTYLACVPTGMR